LDSVLACRNQTIARITVIDDASPEPEISAFLDRLAADGHIDLVRNPINIGFVASCNLAINRAAPLDVVLLNSDTEVAQGWIDGLRHAAYSRSNVASVSPFSNNATIASYPRLGENNHLPHKLSTGTVAAYFSQCNERQTIELPTAVGFCMFMRRAAIERVGLLDVETFGRGYGEESDWCMRARAQGYVHLLAADTFVFHEGEASFGALGRPSRMRAQRVVEERYPHYHQLIDQFVATDPARLARRAVDWERIRCSGLPRILVLTHNLGGGVEKHIHDLAKLMQDECEFFVLQQTSPDQLVLSWAREGEDWRCWYAADRDWELLLATLRELQVCRVHLHHIDGLSARAWSLDRQLNVPLDVTLHDHWPITASYHVSSAELSTRAPVAAEWIQKTGGLLRRAHRVFAPSAYLKRFIERAIDGLQIELWPHQEPVPPKALAPLIKVALLGKISPEKGLDVLVKCAEYVRVTGLQLHFTVIGPTTENIPVFPDLPVEISGSYRDEDLARLIDLSRCDLIWLPVQVAETFSFTLSAALRIGKPIVASKIGAIPERADGAPHVRLVDPQATAEAWCEALVEAASIRQAPATTSAPVDLGLYLNPIIEEAGASVPLAPASAPPARTLYPQRTLLRSDDLPMHELYRYGVECRQAEARNELKRRSAIVDLRMDEAEQRYNAERTERLRVEAELGSALQHEMAMTQELQAHIRKLDDEIIRNQEDALRALDLTRATLEHERDSARAAFEAVTSSRSWRLTAPLRFVGHQLKGILRIGRDAAHQSRALPHKVAVASQILREEGAVALGRRVQEKLSRSESIPIATKVQYTSEDAIEALEMSSSDAPLVSIIIPVYGQHLLTFSCLASIQRCATPQIPFEVIVIDDCSPEPAETALSVVSGIRHMRNEENLGFLKTCNKAAALARGEYVLLLNNDTLVTPGWLSAMLGTFSQRANVGMVGAKLIYPDGRLQEAGGIVWRDGSAWNWGRDQDASLPAFNYLREVDYCSGACLLLQRSFWEEVGGFDERYVPAYYEDTDLAFRVREAGKRVYYQPASVVVHFEGKSSGTDVTQGVKKHQVINQQTFLARWHHVLTRHRLNGLMPHLERDRYAKRRVLVLDACMLTPDQDSGSLRMFELLGLMARLDAKVTFLADNLEYREPYVSQIENLGVEVLYHPVHSNVLRFLERSAADYEVIVLSRATVAVKYVDVVRRVAPRAKLVFDTVDLHFLRQEREAELSGDSLQKAAAARMKAQELSIMQRCDVTLVVSPVEQQLLSQIAPSVHLAIVSNVHVAMPGARGFDERSGAIFIGGFRHPPNLDAITWYAESVLPILRQSGANIVTTVIGSNVPPSLAKYAAEDFIIAGFVADISPYYDAARMSISPLRYGAGVKGKVNMAMQYGVPVIATAASVEGMHLTSGVDVFMADDPSSFADAMITVNTNAALWEQMRTHGLSNIETYFSRRTASRALAELLELPLME
jgi:GT2 family glycosyltransferase